MKILILEAKPDNRRLANYPVDRELTVQEGVANGASSRWTRLPAAFENRYLGSALPRWSPSIATASQSGEAG